MRFAVFVILVLGVVCSQQCPECVEPARILHDECGGVPTARSAVGGYFDCVCGLNSTFFDLYEVCVKNCKALDFLTFNTNNSTLQEFYCQVADKYATATADVTDTFPDAELQLYATGHSKNGASPMKPNFVLTILMCMF